MQLIKSEDFSPSLLSTTVIPTTDSTLLYYLLELRLSARQQNWFTIGLSGTLTHLDSLTLPVDVWDISHRVTSITHIGNKDFIYRQNSLIVRASITEKGTLVDTLFRIPLHPHRGELLINSANNRIVFAHHHHHLFHIMDLETNAVKTIDFKQGIHYYCREYEHCMGCPNPNSSYYVDAFSGENYFYLLFWGHNEYKAFFEHSRRGWRRVEGGSIFEFEKTDEYAQNIPNIVEQYDWNGNLVARYLLEGNPTSAWQRNFWVDEQNRQFILLATDYQLLGRGTWFSRLSLMVYSFCQK
jgi:hypothetical protein